MDALAVPPVFSGETGSGEGQRRSERETVEKAPAPLQFGKLPDPRCPWIVHGFVTSQG